MSDNYDATLLEQLEDTEGENEILSLEVERLTAELERIQENTEKQQRQVIAQLVELFPTQKGLSPEAYGAWLAKKVRDLQSDVSQVRRDSQNGYIDVIITQKATQMYRGDENGMPDPTDRMSYDSWMRNGMKIRNDAPMKNVYRTTKDDLVREYFGLCEMVRLLARQRSNSYSGDQDMLWRIAEQNRMPMFKAWLGIHEPAHRPMPSFKAGDNAIYLQCTPAGREDCEKVLTVLKRAVAKKKEKKKSDISWDDSFYYMTHSLKSTPNTNKRVYPMGILAEDVKHIEELFKRIGQDEKMIEEKLRGNI